MTDGAPHGGGRGWGWKKEDTCTTHGAPYLGLWILPLPRHQAIDGSEPYPFRFYHLFGLCSLAGDRPKRLWVAGHLRRSISVRFDAVGSVLVRGKSTNQALAGANTQSTEREPLYGADNIKAVRDLSKWVQDVSEKLGDRRREYYVRDATFLLVLVP